MITREEFRKFSYNWNRHAIAADSLDPNSSNDLFLLVEWLVGKYLGDLAVFFYDSLTEVADKRLVYDADVMYDKMTGDYEKSLKGIV